MQWQMEWAQGREIVYPGLQDEIFRRAPQREQSTCIRMSPAGLTGALRINLLQRGAS